MLYLVAAQLKVLHIALLKKSCRRCERTVQDPAPSRPIPGSMASAALLADILVSKYYTRVTGPAKPVTVVKSKWLNRG